MVVLLTTASLEGQHLAKSFFNTGLLGAAGSSAPSDDQFNRVSFLSHFEGSNNGVNNAFDDGSASNHTITANGNVTQGSFGPFARPDGEWGVTMPTGPIIQNNYAGSVEVASHSDFTLSGQYTIEFFVNSTTLKNPGGASNIGLFAVGPENNANSMNLFFAGTTVRYWTSTAYKIFGSSSDIVTNSWIHVAVCRNSSNVITCFINGTALGTTFSDTTTPQGEIVIGAEFYQSARYNSLVGSISNFRILNGTCLYTSNFTAPTSALTAITNTKLLTCQSNRFVDNSASGHTVTLTGAPAVTAFGPFLTSAVYDPSVNGASAFFDGDNDSLTTGDSADFVLGDTFTLEAWVYPTVSESNDYPMIMSQAEGYPTGWYFSLRYTNEVNFYLNAADNAGGAIDLNTDGSDPVQLNAWNHIALSVSSGTGYIYVNGARKSSAATGINNNLDRSSTTFRVGVHNAAGAYDFDGYICDARIVKGTALYSGTTYTVPTAPLTAITNTKLLLNMADGQAIDSAAQNNLTLYGNAKISTGQAKFGNTSMLFDGTGDYVTLPSSSFTPFGAGDFTIECFARFDAINGKGLFQLGASYLPSAVTGPAVFASIATNNPWRIYYGTSEADASVSPSANTWYHVAYVRSSGVTKLYVDGTSVISQNDTTNYTNTFFVIGGGYSSSFLMDGYIDDFRISHMARYTSNFTAPSAAFPDKGQDA
jgi:hypothetical protein